MEKIVPLEGKNEGWQITVVNPTDKLAFFVHLKITTKDGKELLPSYWSDNYVSIAPQESQTLTVKLQDKNQKKSPVYLTLDGWNLTTQKFHIAK